MKPFETLLARAWQRRDALHRAPDTTAYRLLNRAGDGFPDLTVDRYADVLVANIYSRGVRVEPPRALLSALAEMASARAVYVKYRPVEARRLDDDLRRMLAPPEPLLGPAAESLEVQENGLRFLIKPGEGLNPGLFLDMREVRRFVRANAAGRTVLNCFAYTCGFAVAALMGGATRVLNLDISRPYLDWGRDNVERNGFPTVPTDFVHGDVFDWLRRFGRRGERFDLVILDPPSYSTARQSRFSAEQDYARLVALGVRVVQPGGRLIACTNCEQLPRQGFLSRVRQGLEGVSARIIRTDHEPAPDFPVAPGAQPYLKVCVVQLD